MEQRFKILGAKSFNDTVEGTKYNSTTLFVELKEKRVVSDTRNVVGFNSVNVTFGEASNFTKHKLDQIPQDAWPIYALLDVEMTTKGLECNSLTLEKPVNSAKPV